MKNRKSMSSFGVIITAAISLILLFVFIGPIIKGIFVDKQVKFAGGQTEQITIDCDGDTYTGFNDQCPCDEEEWKLDGVKNKCGPLTAGAEERCPELCKE